MAFEALEDGVVLAVHRQDPPAAGPGGGDDEAPGEDENFLAGEREVLAGGQGGQRRLEAGRADDRDQDQVGLGQSRPARPGRRARPSAASRSESLRNPRAARQAASSKRPAWRTPNSRAIAASLPALARAATADQLQPVAVGRAGPAGCFADGAGGAEEDDAFAGGAGGKARPRQWARAQCRPKRK